MARLRIVVDGVVALSNPTCPEKEKAPQNLSSPGKADRTGRTDSGKTRTIPKASIVSAAQENWKEPWTYTSLKRADFRESDVQDKSEQTRRSPRKPNKKPISYDRPIDSSASSFVDSGSDCSSDGSTGSLTQRLKNFRLPQFNGQENRSSPRKDKVDLLPRQLFPNVPRLPPRQVSQSLSSGTTGNAPCPEESRPASRESGKDCTAILRLYDWYMHPVEILLTFM